MARSKTDWETIFRKAVERSGVNAAQLAKLSGVDRAQLYRFMRGERSLTIKTAEKLARQIGLELTCREGKK